jgi:hypothetical protein
MRARSVFHAFRRRAAAEEGVALMEVIVAAAVLVLVVLGVLAAMDSVSGTAGANQARTVAASLAEEDQERLRGFATEDLDRLETLQPDPRSIKVGSVTYTVASKAEWISDATGQEASCALPTGDGNYMRITSTVTSPATGAKVPPVVLTSLVAPQPGEGTLAAKVLNSEGNPVQNLLVTATGPETGTARTNEVGCAVFGQLQAGSYEVVVDQSGWVDPNGVQRVVRSATVSSGNLTTVEFAYDRESSLDLDFYTVVNGVTQTNEVSFGAILAHTGLQTGIRTFPATAPPSPALTFDADDLYPFPSPYKIYAGRCTGADPSKYVSNYFDTHPEVVRTLTRGVHGGTVNVLEPAINVTVTWSNGSLVNNNFARVYAYPRTTGCGTTRIHLGDTNSSGKLASPGLPFGQYDLCVQYTRVSSSSTRTYKATWSGMNNTNPAGTPWPVNFTTSSSQSTCGNSSP